MLLMAAPLLRSQNLAELRIFDSLENAYQKAEISQKAVILSEMARRAENFSAPLSEYYLRQQLQLTDSLDHGSMQWEVRLQLARLMLSNGKTDSATKLLHEAIVLHQADILPHAAQKQGLETGLSTRLNWKSSAVWWAMLVSLIILLPFTVVLLLALSHRTKENYLKVQEDYGLFQHQMLKEKQQLEAMITERTAHLESKLVDARAKDVELKKTLKRLKDASYLKDAFLANMSHEIRTPLNGIIGFASLLETELAIMENSELYSYAAGIQQSGDRLLSLINNIIEISRIQANEIEVELTPCDASVIIRNTCETLAFAANEKGLKFKTKLTETPQVVADSAKLMRVLYIVVDNAVKYTDSGFVTISSSVDTSGKYLVIKVKDTGIGIEPGYMKHLFDAFRQESAGYNRPYQGAGLGLPLAKKLVELMHGQIHIHSEKGAGTTVEVSLPLLVSVKTGALPESKPIANAPEIGKPDIFIVEDDRMNRMVLQKLLEPSGNVTLAVDGTETLKIIGEKHKKGYVYQVMLFDINLPAPWDGIQLMQQIKTDYPEYKFVPFIAQTAYAMAGDKERFMDAGFDDYIAKPIRKNELMTKIEAQLKLRAGGHSSTEPNRVHAQECQRAETKS